MEANKPVNGFLMYENRLIEKDKPFALLQQRRKQLSANGFQYRKFHLHYYFSENHLIEFLNHYKHEQH